MTTPSRVLLLTVDSVRSDRLTEECFPRALSYLKMEFATFSNAYSQGNGTPFAFPAIITGYPVIKNGRFPDGSITIPSLFTGQTTGFSNNGHLTYRRGYDQGFDSFHDQHPPDSASIAERLKSITWLRESEVAAQVYDHIQEFAAAISGDDHQEEMLTTPGVSADDLTDYILRRVDSGDEFIWGHYMDPHTPYAPDIAIDGPEVNRSPSELRRLNDYEYETNPHPPEELALQEKLYNANIRYFDREFARLLKELKTRSCYDDTLIILTADHGELFGEHGYMFHPGHIDPVDELLKIPLLVKYPGNESTGAKFDHLVQHGDIIATIADQLGVSSESVPENSIRLRDTSKRYIISKSNVAIRVTEPDAVGIRRRDGSTEGLDTLSKKGNCLIENAEFPRVESMAGEAVGVEEAERRRKLKQLGYKE
jgi:arylsulfatase A-like enzyme